MTNEQLKSAIAAVVLAGFNLWAALVHPAGPKMVGLVSALIVLAAGYFAPRITYLSHAYAGSIGAVVGGAVTVLNLIVAYGFDTSKGVFAAISTLLVAFNALLNPSLVRGPSPE